MRRHFRSLRPIIGLTFAAALLAAVPLPAAHAAADDVEMCRQDSSEPAIAACTRAIASGQDAGHGLAKLHFNRAVEHRRKGDTDRAIADYDEAIRLNPGYGHAFFNRGVAWRAKGALYRALADTIRAARLGWSRH